MTSKPWFIVFLGGMGDSPPEAMVSAVQGAITLDKLQWAASSGLFQGSILVTDRPDLAHQAASLAQVELSSRAFHFGQHLREVVGRYGIERLFYLGGGSGALLGEEDLAAIAHTLAVEENIVITNNLFSADLVAFHPGLALEAIELPATDNPLAQRLRQQAGLRESCLPRNAATQFDVDTPADLLILKVHSAPGEHTRSSLEGLDLDTSRLRAAMAHFTDPDAEVLVAGRVGSYVWAHLETETACRVRVLSEERGMRADGRDERGLARSILGFYLGEVGVARLFDTLAELGEAAFLDSRVIFAHLGLHPSAADRFYSDLGRPEEIGDPFLREFTQGALGAKIPVVLGGHSLVAGGLYALIDAAWQRKDLEAGKEATDVAL